MEHKKRKTKVEMLQFYIKQKRTQSQEVERRKDLEERKDGEGKNVDRVRY